MRLFFSAKGTSMQSAHIFGYSFNISFSTSSIKNISLSIFKRILLFCGLTAVDIAIIYASNPEAAYYGIKYQLLEFHQKSLDKKIASEGDGDLKNKYVQERQLIQKEIQRQKDMIKQMEENNQNLKSFDQMKEYPVPTSETVEVIMPQFTDKNNKSYEHILPTQYDNPDIFIETFKHKLPSKEMTDKVIKDAKRQHPKLRQAIKQLKDTSDRYVRVKHPTRMLFVGPSGCGKTTVAEAIAKHCELTCIFVKASSIATTYQNSGAQFFEMLFRSLKEDDREDYLVIIDEISLVTQMSSDERELQQNKMATAFWLGLDEIRNERHICVIGTTNIDPKTLPEQLKTRFANNIYYFEQPKIDTVINLIKDNLNFVPKYGPHRTKRPELGKLYNCSNEYIQQLAECVSHLSLREIEDLVEKAKVLAISESNDPYAPVTSTHLEKAFAEYTPSWYAKAWRSKATYFKPLVSPRVLTLYAAVAGLIMHFYTKQYREQGLFVTALASVINNFLPRPNGESADMPLFSNIAHWFTSYKYPFMLREQAITS